MFAVQVHLVLNHVPLTGLVLGLVFYVLGIKESSEVALLIGERIFVATGAISIVVLATGLLSAHALSVVQWLDTTAVHSHERAGMLTLVVLIVSGHLKRDYPRTLARRKVGFVRIRTVIVVLATVSFGMVLWTSQLGAELRHSELKPGSETTGFTSNR